MKFRKLNKKSLLILFVLLFVILLGGGIYLYIKNVSESQTPKLDKYSDILNWCDSTKESSSLTTECRALLLDITSKEGTDTCFDLQIISKGEKLQNLKVCESANAYEYTNEILNYKKLMPINVIFTYSRGIKINNYSFNRLSLTKLDNTYVQDIINDDIAELVTTDMSATTIQNSVDFCPRSESLPSYITESNKSAYMEFINKNVLKKDVYTYPSLYNWDDETLNVLFACDSIDNMGYSGICDKTTVKGLKLLNLQHNPIRILPKWGRELDEKDKILLKEISLIYDSMYLITSPNNIVSLALLNNLQNSLNSKPDLNEDVFCNMHLIYKALTDQQAVFEQNKDYIEQAVFDNLASVNSVSCLQTVSQAQYNLSSEGLYIKSSLAKNSMPIISICNNLSEYFKNEQ